MKIIDFNWPHSPNAFRVVRRGPASGSSGRQRRSTTASRSGDSIGIETDGNQWFDLYSPAEIPAALFQRFADMPATAEGMRDFINVYGPLELIGSDKPSARLMYMGQTV